MGAILISVLKSEDCEDMLSCFEDFDKYSFDNYTNNSFFDNGTVFSNDVDYEILGGYIIVLRGYKDVKTLYEPLRVDSPALENIIDDSNCHLIGKTKVNLYAGMTGGRASYHFLFDDKEFIEPFAETITGYYNRIKGEHISGTLKDLNACLKYYDKKFIA